MRMTFFLETDHIIFLVILDLPRYKLRKREVKNQQDCVLILSDLGQVLALLWISFGHVCKERLRLHHLKRSFKLIVVARVLSWYELKH